MANARTIGEYDMKTAPLIPMRDETARRREVPWRLLWALLALLLATPAPAADCSIGPAVAAAANTASINTLAFAPFRRPEIGWATYAPKIATEIGSFCPFGSPGFAAALARWQAAHKQPATGIVDIESFAAMNAGWTLARPFVRAARGGACPDAPDAAVLATAGSNDGYGGKTIQLRADALAAWHRMMVAARRDLPQLTSQGDWFRIFSGFRHPLDDDLRCWIENNCQGVTRAACSPHRTGTAIDVFVGQTAGFGPDSSDDGNRRAMTRTAAYRWLVQNAGRFGFANYVFEPWHWEWAPPARVASTPPLRRGMTPG